MTLAVVSLGGNLGIVAAAFDSANRSLRETEHIINVRTSPVYRSQPMGAAAGAAGATFWNAVTAFETSLDAHAVLDVLQSIENQNGRTREVHWGPRTLDLDLVLFGDQVIDTARLRVPHPHFFYRRFVVEPAAALVPDAVDPVSGCTMAEFHERLQRRPFRILVTDEIEIEPLRTEFRVEFPCVEFEPVATTRDESQCSLGLRRSEPGPSGEHESNRRFWIQLASKNPIDEIRWILEAACGNVELGFSRDS